MIRERRERMDAVQYGQDDEDGIGVEREGKREGKSKVLTESYVTSVRPLSPPLHYAGGKRWLLPVLARTYESIGRPALIEPFAGALSVALGLRPRFALLNDACPHVINFYRWLRQSGFYADALHCTPALYAAKRNLFNKLIQLPNGIGTWSEEAAKLFYYLNRTCFNGLCRFNSRGLFNTPIGTRKTLSYIADSRDYAGPMREWCLESVDFEMLLVDKMGFRHQPTLMYVDPPYDQTFSSYTAKKFTWADQVRLVKWLDRFPDMPVLASNSATRRIIALYRSRGFNVQVISNKCSINSDIKGRGKVNEVLMGRNVEVML